MFLENTAAQDGGAAHVKAASPELMGCTFTENTAQAGGAIWLMDADATAVRECTFSANVATVKGRVCACGGWGRRSYAHGLLGHRGPAGQTPAQWRLLLSTDYWTLADQRAGACSEVAFWRTEP